MTEQTLAQTSPRVLPLKAVLFDLDDTLFDHTYSSQQGLAALIQNQDCFRAVPTLAIAQIYAELLETYHVRVLQGEITLDEARIARTRQLFAYYGAQIECVQVEQAIARYMTAYRRVRQVVPGGLALLQALHTKVHIVVVTNNLTAEQVGKIQACGLEPLIDALVTAEDVGAAKPDPVMFETALKRVGCTAQEAVVIGDSWSADILGARRAGIRAIWLNRTGQVCPDATIASEIQALEPLEQVLAAIYQR
jgi:putative hydrolase of the HAD superfamily